MLDKQSLIATVKAYYKKQQDIVAVYLFGSYSKDKQRSSSDLDIGVLFTSDIDLVDRFERKLEQSGDLEDLIPVPVDVVDLRSADPYFLHQIFLSKELILDVNTEERVAFEVESRRTYFDRQPFYELYHREALRRLEDHHG